MSNLSVSHQADTPLFYAFLALLVWIPLPLGSNKAWAISLLCILVFALSAWWLSLYTREKLSLSKTFLNSLPVICLLLTAPLWALWQLLLDITIDCANTLQDALLGFALVGMFTLTTLLVRSQRRIKLLGFTLVGSGLFQAVYGSMMTLTGIEYLFFVPKEHYLNLATGTFVNRNHLAGYLELTLAVGIGLMIATLDGSRSANLRDFIRRTLTTLLGNKARLRIILVMMVAGLVMTHSRMGNTAFFASLAIAGVLALILSKRSTKATIILISSLIIIDLFVVGTFFGVEKVVQRLENTAETSETRDEANTYTLEAIQDNLLTGSGAGSFYTLFPAYREQDVGRGFYDHTHNDYFEFASDYGVVVTGCLLLAVLWVFISAIRAQIKRKKPLMRGIAFSSTMAIIALAIHSTVDFNLQIPANAATFMVILALGQVALHMKSNKKRRS
ncbi:O-antigen ligase family protein [Amphritea sp. 1_MG-2023]|uniref:O-antigen ligase family protein n=1 Tax=Amphritea sp. 1_MG-2023 TaxID=3062670 RepID=UPI0026E3FDEA|nr:O-antigen ligase family protein [Amphritea sp. 1_MG-2023]MDO6565132.1 O-antigen ligase family protein [Amphritea sp. 1_MG-2023]